MTPQERAQLAEKLTHCPGCHVVIEAVREALDRLDFDGATEGMRKHLEREHPEHVRMFDELCASRGRGRGSA